MHDAERGRRAKASAGAATRAGTTVPTWDGTPIDVAVAFPAATGSDNNYPVVGIYHGWGGTKIRRRARPRSAG